MNQSNICKTQWKRHQHIFINDREKQTEKNDYKKGEKQRQMLLKQS